MFYSDAKVAKKPELETVLYIKLELLGIIWTFYIKLTERISFLTVFICHAY